MERAGTSYTVQLNLGTVGQTDARGRRPVLVLVKCRYFCRAATRRVLGQDRAFGPCCGGQFPLG